MDIFLARSYCTDHCTELCICMSFKCQFAKTFDVISESKKEDCVACVCECRAEGQGE